MATVEDIKLLFSEFPKDAISWRAQSVTKDGSKAMALAYIDARDVMDRLDQAIGAADWQDRYEFHGSRTICYLSIRVEGEWITKADGAGDSDVEAEKGAISDALKRAAVKWGIGRYLYALDAPWVPCETAEWNGKKQWKKWTADPWNFVKLPPPPRKPNGLPQVGWRGDGSRTSFWMKNNGTIDELKAELYEDAVDCHSLAQLAALRADYVVKSRNAKLNREFKDVLEEEFAHIKRGILASMDAAELAEVPLKDALHQSLAQHPLNGG
jgi:hypothetical protein